MTDLFEEPAGATPLAPADRGGLLQSWITHRRDLNEAEQANIAQGAAWARGNRSRKAGELLTEEFARQLHRRMFGDVWSWAGTYRTSATNIGIDPARVAAEMPAMLDDVRYWVDHRTFPADEIAVRLHHRLTVIHPFPNGNGRHARLMADLLIEQLGGEAFSWGSGRVMDAGALRARYIAAQRAADNHDLGPLISFARS